MSVGEVAPPEQRLAEERADLAEAGAALLRNALEQLVQDYEPQVVQGTQQHDHLTHAKNALRTVTAGQSLLEALRVSQGAVNAAIPCIDDWVKATGRGRLTRRDEAALKQLLEAKARLNRFHG